MKGSFPPSPAEVRAYLDKHKKTIPQVAKTLGVGERVVSYWIAEKTTPGRSQQMNFCQWFTLIYLTEGRPPGRIPSERR